MSDSLQPHGLQPLRFPCPWGFSRQEYWSGLLFPSLDDLPHSGIELVSSALAGGFFFLFFTTKSPGKPEIGPLQHKNEKKKKKNNNKKHKNEQQENKPSRSPAGQSISSMCVLVSG